MTDFALVVVQIGVVMAVARLVATLFRTLHQPQVVGELVAGILLGPSLLGWLAPSVSAALFPLQSLGFLSMLSQLGLLIFMFLVGLELDPDVIRGASRKVVVATSNAGIA